MANDHIGKVRKVYCPYCSYEGKIAETLITSSGKSLKCPSCKKLFTVGKNDRDLNKKNEIDISEDEDVRLSIVDIKYGVGKEAGLKVNDLLYSYKGIPITSSDILSKIMKEYEGEIHTLEVIRRNKLLNIEIKAGELGLMANKEKIIKNNLKKIFEEKEKEVKYTQQLNSMLLSTTPFIPSHKIVSSIDIITSECAFGMNIFKDIFTGLTDFIGGSSKTTQKALKDAKDVCLLELKKEALLVGANAIVGIDLDYSEFSGQGKSMLFLVASGTAVKIEPVIS